jgi:hypothetical protein
VVWCWLTESGRAGPLLPLVVVVLRFAVGLRLRRLLVGAAPPDQQHTLAALSALNSASLAKPSDSSSEG